MEDSELFQSQVTFVEQVTAGNLPKNLNCIPTRAIIVVGISERLRHRS